VAVSASNRYSAEAWRHERSLPEQEEQMRFSLTVVHDPAVGWPEARQLARLGSRAEELGFHAIYFGDHFVNRPFLNAATALAALCGATEQIRLGFAAYVLPFRHPIVAAHELAMLDHLSGGRLIAGLASGSTFEEFEALQVPFEKRGRLLDEGIEALVALWTQERASHEGSAYRFNDVVIQPKPLQQPYPPIWIASWTGSPRAARRIARWANGWQSSGLHTSFEEIPSGWRSIEAACLEIGRDPSTIDRAYVNMVTYLAADREQAWRAVRPQLREREDLRLIGTPDDAVSRLQKLAGTGTREVSLLLQSWADEQLELIAGEVMPALRTE
jgi:alkanesulfonate monooxygenase